MIRFAPRTFAAPAAPAPPALSPDGGGGFVRWGPPSPTTLAVGVLSAVGYYRVADPAVEGYQLYRGVDADPDLAAAPWETFAALPHDAPALAPGHAYRFVLRRRNRWGLASHNADATEVVVDGGGVLVPPPPSAPYEVAAAATAGGTVTLTARYRPLADGVRAADQWLVYLTADGSTPDPATDAPATVQIDASLGYARLSYATAPLAEGTVVKALVRVRRSGPPAADSVNAGVVTATATLVGPTAVAPADAFLGTAARQQQ